MLAPQLISSDPSGRMSFFTLPSGSQAQAKQRRGLSIELAGTMDNAGKTGTRTGSNGRYQALVPMLILLACVWLVPAGGALAVSSPSQSGSTSVSVTVRDAVFVNAANPLLSAPHGSQKLQITTTIVTRTASGCHETQLKSAGEAGLPIGQEAVSAAGAVRGGCAHPMAGSASGPTEVFVTVTML